MEKGQRVIKQRVYFAAVIHSRTNAAFHSDPKTPMSSVNTTEDSYIKDF